MRYWIIRDAQEFGPYEKEELFSLLNDGQITREDAARADGSEESLSVHRILEQPLAMFALSDIESLQSATRAAAEANALPLSDVRERAPARPKPSRGTLAAYLSRAGKIAACLLLLAGGAFYLRHQDWKSMGDTLKMLFRPTGTTAESNRTVGEPATTAENPDPASAPHPDDSAATAPMTSGTAPMADGAPAANPVPDAASAPMQRAEIGKSLVPLSSHPGVLSRADLMEVLAQRFSTMPVRAYEDEEAWSKERKTTFQDSFELETPLKWNPKVRVQYRVPMTAQGQPTPAASNIVLFCTWPGGAQPPAAAPAGAKTTGGLQGALRPFTEGLGFTAFSLEIVTDRSHGEDPRETYYLGGPEWIEVVREARLEIIRRHHLRAKKLLIYGASMGGTFAQRVGVALGNEAAAVAIQNAPDATLPAAAVKTAWFVAVTRGDACRQTNADLARTFQALGTPCVHAITPPAYAQRGAGDMYHSVSPEARRAAFLFLAAIVERSDGKGENDPPHWPYVRDAEKPLMIVRNDDSARQKIPPARREYMPSRDFVHTLQSMPVPMQTVLLGPEIESTATCLAGLPPLGRPKGAIILSQQYTVADVAQLLNDINFLAGKGYVVLAPRVRGNPLVDLETVTAVLAREPVLTHLPVAFIGVGDQNETVWRHLLTSTAARPAACIPINFNPRDLLDQAKWPLGRHVEWPLLFLYDEKEVTATTGGEETLKKIRTFASQLQQQNLVAAVRLVPPGPRSDEQGAQKKIETACQFIDASVGGKIRTEFH